jgi:hypothetical protein
LPADVAPAQADARAIACEAYIYGFPLVDGYRRLHAFFVDREHHDYKGAWNEIHHEAHVFTATDRSTFMPDGDTVASTLGLDLRREPMVLSVPRMADDRYYAIECNDLYSAVFGYIGSRATGNRAGDFLIAGPEWPFYPFVFRYWMRRIWPLFSRSRPVLPSRPFRVSLAVRHRWRNRASTSWYRSAPEPNAIPCSFSTS